MIRDDRLGNTPRWYLTPLKDYGMRVPDSILECVAFLGVPNYAGGNAEEIVVRGTAFFVSVPSEHDPKRRYQYLVTSQHCLDEAGSLPLHVRLNPYVGDARDQDYTLDMLKQTSAKIEATHPGTRPRSKANKQSVIDYIVQYSGTSD